MTEAKVIIAGGRLYADYRNVKRFLDHYLSNLRVNNKLVVVSGACDRGVLTFTRPDGTKVYGADGMGERWAAENDIPVMSFPANWDMYGKKAGMIRNDIMAKIGTHAVVFWDGKSRGSKDMIEKAEAHKLPKKVVRYGTMEDLGAMAKDLHINPEGT